MPYYRPRMAAVLSVPVWGAPGDRIAQADKENLIEFQVNVRRAEHVKNDHNHADELRLTLDWLDAGVDPRLLSNGIVEFYLGNADEDGTFELHKDGPNRNRQFLGIITEVERGTDTSARYVELQALDFTTLLLEARPYPPEGIPTYDMTLEEAWKHICSYAGGKDVYGEWFKSAELLADKLVPRGVEGWPPSLSAVAPKLKTLKTPIHVKADSDAWGVWQQACGMLGLISWIVNDTVIVSTSTNYYTSKNPPRLILGKNISSMRERRNCAVAGKKIGLVSYDPLTGRLVQAWYPPRGEKGTKKAKTKGRAKKADDYEIFEYNGVTDEAALQTVCQRAYEERSRQELEGTIVTSEMFVEGLNGDQAALLRLGAGQDVRVELEQETLDGLQNVSGLDARLQYLLNRGYRRSVAELLAKNQGALSKLTPVFHTKGVRTTLETDEKGGSFEVEITYCNRIEVTGNATA